MKTREKYRVGIQNYYNFAVSLNEVYILDVHDKNTIEIEPVLGISKLDELIRNTYRYRYLNGQGMRPLHFQQCAAAAEKIDAFRGRRPRDGFKIHELADAIERNIFSNAR